MVNNPDPSLSITGFGLLHLIVYRVEWIQYNMVIDLD